MRTVHVEDQVLTHDGKADEADIGTVRVVKMQAEGIDESATMFVGRCNPSSLSKTAMDRRASTSSKYLHSLRRHRVRSELGGEGGDAGASCRENPCDC